MTFAKSTAWRGRRARMRGQALILTVALLAVLCLGVLLLFNTGQTVNAKVRLTDATDAAAYSVAAEQARAMNFAAYMNRGRVANEVAVAQMVSMYSWVNQLHTHTGLMQGALDVLSSLPLIGAAFLPLKTVYTTAREVLNAVRLPFLKTGIDGVVYALDSLNGFYADAAAGVIAHATSGDDAALARAVLARNDPAAEFVPAGRDHLVEAQLPAARREFLEHHHLEDRRTPGMDRYRNVVMESRDWFTRDRSAKVRIGDSNQYNYDFLPVPIGGFGLRNDNWLASEGGTDMVDYDRWAGLDASSLDIEVEAYVYVGRCLPWPVGCVQVKKTLWQDEFKTATIGHGGAQAVERANGQAFRPGYDRGRGFDSMYEITHLGETNYADFHYDPYNNVRGFPGTMATLEPAVTNPYYGDRGASRGDEFIENYKGLRAYDDVLPDRARDPDDGPVFTVYARSAQDRVRTSDVVGIGGPDGSATHLEGDAAGGYYTALASAQVYFARPTGLARFRRVFRDGGSAMAEGGSLFSPYWQARLVETPAASRGALGIPTP